MNGPAGKRGEREVLGLLSSVDKRGSPLLPPATNLLTREKERGGDTKVATPPWPTTMSGL